MPSLFSEMRALWQKSELILFLVLSELKKDRADFFLGYVWWILNPLLWMLVYWVFLAVIMGHQQDNHLMFLFAGIMPWRAFITAVSKAMSSVSSRRSLIKQIVFPRAVLPLSSVLAETLMMLPGFIIIIGASYLMGSPLSPNLLFLPLVILCQFLLAFALGIFLSITVIYLPDMKKFIQIFLRIWLYLSPVLYELKRVPEGLRYLYELNPMVGIFESYHSILLYQQPPNWSLLGVSFLLSVVCLLVGCSVFFAFEKRVVKVI